MEYDIDKLLEAAKKLRKQRKLKEAYNLCVEIIEVDSENREAIGLLKDLEKEIRDIGIFSVKENIKKLEPLWDKGNYVQLVKEYQKLYELVPNYEPLQGLLAKAEIKLKKQAGEQKKLFIENFKTELLKMFEEGRYEDLILKTSQTQAAYPSNKQIAGIGRELRTMVVESELSKNKPLLKSHRYQDVIQFLKRLKIIEPSYAKIEKLILEYKKKGLNNLNDAQQEFVYRGLSHAETLLQLGKYEYAEEAAREVLSTDPGNTQAKSILKEASKKAKKQIQKEIVVKIKNNFPALREEYNRNKEGFVKI